MTKPILESKVTNDYSLSLLEELKNNKNKFQSLWQNVINDNSILYPIYDLSNVIKDIKVKVVNT